MSPLGWITQEDFAAGTLRSIGRGLDQGVGLWNAINGFFDDDGDCYLRGNTAAFSTGAAVGPLTFLWTGMLSTPATLASSATKLDSITAGALAELVGTPVARPVRPAIVKDELFLPNGVSWKGTGVPLTGQLPAALPGMVGQVCLAACANRLVIGQGRFIRFSKSGDPHTFDPTDYHELAEGTVIRGMSTIHDTLIVFTNYGVWSVQNLVLDLTDDFGNPQQQLSKIIPELALLHEAGLTEWSGQIVAPCSDRCYLIDGVSPPVAISDSIAPLYTEHVAAGRLPGGAKAFRNHWFLPWLDLDGSVASVMVFRLNRPIRGRLVYYPVTILDGHAAGMVMGDFSQLANAPTLLVAHHDGKIYSYGELFDVDRNGFHDADGTAPLFDLETRDFATGTGQPNHVRELRLHYTLDTDGQATVTGALSTGAIGQNYELLRQSGSYQDVKDAYASYESAFRGGFVSSLPPGPWSEEPDRYWYSLSQLAADSPGLDPMKWHLAQAKRVRFIRARFRCSDPVLKLIVHRIDVGIRPATHTR